MILRGKILPTTSSFVDWSDESLGILGLENMEVQLTREWWVWVRDCNGWEYISKRGRASATVVRSVAASSTSAVAAAAAAAATEGAAALVMVFLLGDLCVGEYNLGRRSGPIYIWPRYVCMFGTHLWISSFCKCMLSCIQCWSLLRWLWMPVSLIQHDINDDRWNHHKTVVYMGCKYLY